MSLGLVILSAVAFLGLAGTALGWKRIRDMNPGLPLVLVTIFGAEEIAFLVLAVLA